MIDLLRNRRSIRNFKNCEVEADKVDKIIKAALMSPSSRNINPWEFIVVKDPELLSNLSHSKEHGSQFLKNAPLAIVVLADEIKSDAWIEDSSIASTIIQLTAQSLGLGSCWIQIRNRMYSSNLKSEDYIKELLAVPDNYKIESIIALGYPNEIRPPFDESKLQFQKIHNNKFND